MMLINCGHIMAQEGIYTVIIKKQEDKINSRWSLSDWLLTKKKMALQDQWLALHSSTQLFEFIFDYSEGHVDISKDSSPQKIEHLSKNFGAEFFISIFGLGYADEQVKKNYHQKEGWASLRIFGTSSQVAHLNIDYGVRFLRHQFYSSFQQQFYGVRANIYLIPILGIEGLYRKYNEDSGLDRGYTNEGERMEYGAFLDLLFLRVYIKLFKENLYLKNSLQTNDKEVHQGKIIGLKLFF